MNLYGAIEERNNINDILKTGRTAGGGTGSGIDRHLYLLSKYNVNGKLSESDVIWDKEEKTLNTWLVRILNEIENNPKVIDKFNAKLTIHEIFEVIYTDLGYTYNHPLYRSAKLALFKVGEVLEEANVIESNSFSVNQLDNLLKSYGKPMAKYLYNNLQKNPTANQFASKPINLRKDIISIAPRVSGNTFSLEHAVKIYQIFEEYSAELAEFRVYNTLLKKYEKDYGNSYRLSMIRDLLDKCKPLRQLLGRNMDGFTNLVFGRTGTTGLAGAFDLKEDSRPEHGILFDIIFKSYGWTVKTFSDLGVSTDYSELKQLRIDIREVIYKWIRLSTYKPPLVDQGLIRDKNPYMPELEMIYSLLFAARLKTGNPDLTFTDLFNQKLYHGKAWKSALLQNLREGHPFNTNSLRQFRDVLKGWIKEEGDKINTDHRKQDYYFDALDKIGMVARLTGRNIRGVVAIKGGGKFNTPAARVYNVILGLGRHLGFDPGTFLPIEDQMFDMNADARAKFKELGLKIYYYARHHFEDNPDRTSLELRIQILTDGRNHLYWDSMMSEADGLVAIQVIENLIKYNRLITKNDIRKEFGRLPDEYSVIMENWFRQRDFKDNLALFNKRKDDIKSMTLDSFIKEHYKSVYSKFYNTILKNERVNVRKLIEALHPGVDVSGLVSLGPDDNLIGPFTRVFAYILRDLGYLVHF